MNEKLELIRKTFPAIETKVLSDSEGIVQTIFAVTENVDRQDDRIKAGAFTGALEAKASVPVVYAHDWQNLDAVLGRTTAWKELMPGDPGLHPALQAKGLGGVLATVQFEMGVPAGRTAFTHVKNRNITEWSWAFTVADGGEKSMSDSSVREITKIGEIFEVTLALVGANPDTVTMALKGFSPKPARQSRKAATAALLAATAALIDD